MQQVTGQVTSLGERLGRYRRSSGQRQEDVVDRAREHGLRWTKSVVTNIEAGRREVGWWEWLLLPVLYGSNVVDLIFDETGPTIEPVAGVQLNRRALERLLAIASDGGEIDTDQLGIVAGERPLTEVDRRMARQLGVAPTTVADLARSLYGCALIEERDRRVNSALEPGEAPGDDRLRGLRGRLTRQLADELRTHLNERAQP